MTLPVRLLGPEHLFQLLHTGVFRGRAHRVSHETCVILRFWHFEGFVSYRREILHLSHNCLEALLSQPSVRIQLVGKPGDNLLGVVKREHTIVVRTHVGDLLNVQLERKYLCPAVWACVVKRSSNQVHSGTIIPIIVSNLGLIAYSLVLDS